MIRLATHDDIPELVRMLIAFQAEARCYNQIDPCEKSIAKSVQTFIDKEMSDVCVYEDNGVIAGATAIVAYPSWFNFAQKTGQEMFWYIKPEYRGKPGIAMRMFRWLESWAEDKNLTSLTVASTGTLNVDRLGEFYEKRGYIRWDVLYTKGLNHACISR